MAESEQGQGACEWPSVEEGGSRVKARVSTFAQVDGNDRGASERVTASEPVEVTIKVQGQYKRVSERASVPYDHSVPVNALYKARRLSESEPRSLSVGQSERQP